MHTEMFYFKKPEAKKKIKFSFAIESLLLQ